MLNKMVFVIGGAFFAVINIWNLQCFSSTVLIKFQLCIKILLGVMFLLLLICSFGTYNVVH